MDVDSRQGNLELIKLFKRHRMDLASIIEGWNDDSFELTLRCLERWRDRVARSISSNLNNAEVMRFRGEEIYATNLNGSVSLANNLDKQEAYVMSLINELEKYPEHCLVKAESSSVLVEKQNTGRNIFIGHGRSDCWRALRGFIESELKLPWDEFSRVPVAGTTTRDRLLEMLDNSCFAFLILTCDDELASGDHIARMNVIHETGLFQGRLGFERAIVVLENGCQEFSNIHGIGQIRFEKNNISSAFEEVRGVLKREGVVLQ